MGGTTSSLEPTREVLATVDWVLLNSSSNKRTLSPSSSTLDEHPDHVHEWSRAFSSTIASILIMAAFFAISGNAMVLAILVRHRGMRTRTNLFLVNLAVADLLVGVFLMPFSISTLINHGWVFGDGFICTFNGWMNSFCLITSIHTLMYIGIHKYFSIVHPMSTTVNLRTILVMMGMAWLWAGICSTLNVYGLEIEYKHGTSQCGPKYPSNVRSYIIHTILQLTVMVIPFFTLVYCYTRMFVAIKRHSVRMRRNSTMDENYILATQKKMAITLFIVLATFCVMALPYVTYATYTTVKRVKHFMAFNNPLAYMCLYLNSMMNPIIYAFRSPAFREGYKEILCQTPRYTITDDTEFAPRTTRLSSLISNLRRGSACSNPRLSTVLAGADSPGELSQPKLKATAKVAPPITSPTSGDAAGGDRTDSETLASKREQLKKAPKKSLNDLLRATRVSDTQSVVHCNGDVIIMKGGKIVSVHRREEQHKEKTTLLDRLAKLAQDADKETAVSVTTESDAGLTQSSDKREKSNMDVVREEDHERFLSGEEGVQSDDGRSEGSSSEPVKQSVSEGAGLRSESENDLSSQRSDSKDTIEAQNQKFQQTNEKTGVTESPAVCKTENLSDDFSESNLNSLRATQKVGPIPDVSHYRDTPAADTKGISSDTPLESSTPTIFIDLDENDHVKGVVPLDHVTKARLERAVTFTQADEVPGFALSLEDDLAERSHRYNRHGNRPGPALQSRHTSRHYSHGSSEDAPPTEGEGRLLRLPSLEYLDPPSSLFASNGSSKPRQGLRKSASTASSSPRPGRKGRLSRFNLSSLRRDKWPANMAGDTQL